MSGEIIKIQREVEMELSNKETLATLIGTTFKGLSEISVRQAMVEGMVRGFTFKNFLEKDVYAIPFGSTYSLVTSIDYQQKIAMKSGVTGIDEPVYEEDPRGGVISCSVTVRRKIPGGDIIGAFTAKVYFAEYTTGRGLWLSKPRTMIAKVGRSHALRMACPEELSQSYVEEEVERGDRKEAHVRPPVDMTEWEKKLKATTSLEELGSVWASLPPEAKPALKDLKNGLKEQYQVK